MDARRRWRIHALVSFVLSWRTPLLLAFVLPLVGSLTWPEAFLHQTDYLLSFYAAGRLVWDGRAAEIYPDVSANSMVTAPLNRFAHELLPHLPKEAIGAFPYGPLVAWLLAPLSLLDPRLSMASWQSISMVALALCMLLLGPASRRSFSDTFYSSALYFPIYHTLLIGHTGLTFGLAPLCAGYVCLLKNWPVLAGLSWSLLLLKPQFLPVALLVVGALALSGRRDCAFGFITGVVLIIGLSAILLSPQVVFKWMVSHRFSDTIFSDPQYGYPIHLVSSLPAASLYALPAHLRDVAKIVGYALAALIGVHALWRSRHLLRDEESAWPSSLSLVFLLGIAVLPLVVPHLLAYDLSVFAVAGVLMTGEGWSNKEAAKLKRIGRLYLLAINAYVALFILAGAYLAKPPFLVAALALLYIRVLRIVEERIRATKTRTLAAEVP